VRKDDRALSTQRPGTLVGVLALAMGLSTAAVGQIRLVGESDAAWTVLTVAPDGAWGTATEEHVNRAIANAVARCRTTAGQTLGCGAYLVTIQRGWALGLRCGDQSILTTGKTLSDAVDTARAREDELRRNYAPAMPECSRIVAVAPDGSAVTPSGEATASASDRMR
jgi:hypothetical protein